MITPRPLVRCLFCGLLRPASEEDVISKWIGRTLQLTSEVIIRAEPTGATARTQHLRVTLQDMVCEECNNTWMSRLENRVKPFLEPMLTHRQGAALDAVQRRALARWAVMKVLLMEYAMRQRRAHLRAVTGYQPSEPELAWLYKHDDPPPRSRVWLGAFDAGNRQVVTSQSRLLVSDPAFGSADLPSHLTTLTIGYVLLQVFSTNFVLADVQSLPPYDLDPPPPYGQALTRVWPSAQASVPWPPQAYVSPEILDKTANWGQPTNPVA